ncbi:MAG: hypothetical protein A2Y72_02380 [Chloroflexi bacterium RBG_13_53_26]|jgi:hypothetical protein|nr:MAG: hypothetical protein A2Y72_02380 [Chloroflexi bacterium RBG_13_53_26]
MDVETFENDPRAFCDTALPFLTEAEAENNLLIGVSSRLAAEHSTDSPQSFFWTVHDGPRTCGAGMWMPPHDLALSHPFPAAALAALSELLVQMRLALPGVLGPDYAAREFAAKWTVTGIPKADLWRRERIYRLQRVEPLPLTPGRMMRAEGEHVAGLTPWVDDFLRETGENEQSLAILSAAIAGGRLFVWWNGKPVSMAAWARPTPNGVCVNLVYTPPEERRRGYATAVVSTLSSMLLGQGRSFCALYTDLSNPTSNSMYQRIGYVPILDCYHYRFLR